MGVTADLLSRVLRTAGRQVDLSDYSHGIVAPAKQEGNKRQKTLRPLRIGLDAGGLIAKGGHGLGNMLLDERHLSNYGRAMLEQETTNSNGDGSTFNDGSTTNNNASTSTEAAVASQEAKQAYVRQCTKYVMHRIRVLRQVSGAEVLVVLDGATPPLKRQECQSRSDKRKAAAQQRDEPLQVEEEARTNAKRRVRAARRAGAGSNHGAIVQSVIQELRHEEIPFLVSPYEADGQLAHLQRHGMIDLVITEDSDLIAHGSTVILYKCVEELGKGSAQGILVQQRDLSCMPMLQKGIELYDFSQVMLAVLFVCLGCDYCDSLRQIGSVTARKIVLRAFKCQTERPALEVVFELLYQQTTQENLTDDFKEEYESKFLAALFMFRHSIVFCPLSGECVMSRHVGCDAQLMDYAPYAELCHDAKRREQILGTCHNREIAIPLAEGLVDPRTLERYPNVVVPAAPAENGGQVAEDETQQASEATGPETQDVSHPETQMETEDTDNGPETQDVSHPETQDDGPETQMNTGPETQDAIHPETQMQDTPKSVGPETQDSPMNDPSEPIGPETQDATHPETQMQDTPKSVDEGPETQDATHPETQIQDTPKSVDDGPETQDATHPETQMQDTPKSVDDGPETQDMHPEETQESPNSSDDEFEPQQTAPPDSQATQTASQIKTQTEEGEVIHVSFNSSVDNSVDLTHDDDSPLKSVARRIFTGDAVDLTQDSPTHR